MFCESGSNLLSKLLNEFCVVDTFWLTSTTLTQPVTLVLFAQEAEVTPAAPQSTTKAAGKKVAEAPDAGSLALGSFSLQPATAALAVGAKQHISLTFNAQGANLSLQQLGIDVSDR